MNYTFENIAGYQTEKEELKRLCEIFNNREKYQKKGAKLPKGIIFYGESGTGKTLFSKVMASECDLEILKINVADAVKETDICKLIKKAFNKASHKKEPTMIFFDELDKVLPNYEERYMTDRSKSVLTQLLTLIDGMETTGNVVFVATCNNYESIPETLVRPG
jgi:cell division protease FtsH